jgi:hypothetical protein
MLPHHKKNHLVMLNQILIIDFSHVSQFNQIGHHHMGI